jgi:hypothetical protein
MNSIFSARAEYAHRCAKSVYICANLQTCIRYLHACIYAAASTAATGVAAVSLHKSPEDEVEIGYAWHANASVMELHPTIPSLLHASRSMLLYPVENPFPQLDRNAGYL